MPASRGVATERSDRQTDVSWPPNTCRGRGSPKMCMESFLLRPSI